MATCQGLRLLLLQQSLPKADKAEGVYSGPPVYNPMLKMCLEPERALSKDAFSLLGHDLNLWT